MNRFFKEELNPFLIFIGSSIVFVISLCEFQIIKCCDIGPLGIFLKSDGIETISGGIVSAYILYIFIEVLPRYKRENKAKTVLNQAIASVVEGFFDGNPFQHEKSIRHVKFDLVNTENKINEAIASLKAYNVQFWQLNFVMQTAHSRHSDFKNLLAVAITISPEHALFWLDLTDKIRLLSEEYGRHEDFDSNILNDLTKINTNVAEMSITELYCSGLILRTMELFESVLEWNEL